MMAPPVSDLWTEHLRKHGPKDEPEVLELLLALAPYADLDGETGYVDEHGELIRLRLAPCRECGLGRFDS